MDNTTEHQNISEVYNSDNLELIAMVIVGILSVTGTVGNALVIYVFARQKQKLTSTIYIFTLACTDFVTSLVTMPFTIGVVLVEFRVEFDIVCKLYQFLVTSTVPFSAFVMVAIAFDRYLCIVHPFKHMKSMTTKRAKVVVTLLFFLAMTLGLLCCLIHGTYSREVKCVKTNNVTLDAIAINATKQYRTVTDQVQCNATFEKASLEIVYTGECKADNIIFDHSYRTVYQKIYSAFFAVCAVVVIVLYAVIYRTVFTRRRQHLKTAIMLSIVAVTYIVAFMPAWLMALRVLTYNAVIYFLYFTYNVANPITYAFLNENFRNQLRDAIKCRSQPSPSLGNEAARKLQTTTPQL